jgi:hypothetical protein
MQVHPKHVGMVEALGRTITIFTPDGDDPSGEKGLHVSFCGGVPIITVRDARLDREVSVSSAHDISFLRDACDEVLKRLSCESAAKPSNLYLSDQLRADAGTASDGFGSS